jgi:hypothetical protein
MNDAFGSWSHCDSTLAGLLYRISTFGCKKCRQNLALTDDLQIHLLQLNQLQVTAENV